LLARFLGPQIRAIPNNGNDALTAAPAALADRNLRDRLSLVIARGISAGFAPGEILNNFIFQPPITIKFSTVSS
jgi:hypothetical protein